MNYRDELQAVLTELGKAHNEIITLRARLEKVEKALHRGVIMIQQVAPSGKSPSAIEWCMDSSDLLRQEAK